MSQADIGKQVIKTNLSVGFIKLVFLTGSVGQEPFINCNTAWYFGEVARMEGNACSKTTFLSSRSAIVKALGSGPPLSSNRWSIRPWKSASILIFMDQTITKLPRFCEYQSSNWLGSIHRYRNRLFVSNCLLFGVERSNGFVIKSFQ